VEVVDASGANLGLVFVVVASKVDADADGEKDVTGNALGLDLICNQLSSSPSNAHGTQ
jgi:hypothetical protein